MEKDVVILIRLWGIETLKDSNDLWCL